MKKLHLKTKNKILIKNLILYPFRILGLLFLRNKKITIVTAASSNHFKSMLQLINSIKLLEKGKFELVAYDLGLKKDEKDFFNKINPNISLKEFDYSNYPSFFNIEINAGAFAWKPTIIYYEYNLLKKNDYILWLDAGCFLTKSLFLVKTVLWLDGLYCTFSGNIIKNFTHVKTLETIGKEEINTLKMFQASTIGLKVGSKENDALINSWYRNSCQESIISPKGSNLSNHRYDQSLLSIQIYKSYNTLKRPFLSYQTNEIQLHKDIG
ncbi:MAG: DUF1647 domain-containing protein [Methylococcaceae bacterium]